MRKRLLRPAVILILLSVMMVLSAGTSAVIVQAQDSSPKSVIMNVGQNAATAVNFTWNTISAVGSSIVEYIPKASFTGFNKNFSLKVSAHSYTTKTNKDTRRIFKAELMNLTPGTEYVYRVGNSIDGYSAQGQFRTAAATEDKFTFINITDTQGVGSKDYGKWKNTLDAALGKYPDTRFLVHTGDMVDNGDNISQWDLFAGAVTNEFLTLPIAPAIGNHEAFNTNKSNPDFKNYTDRFNTPGMQASGAVETGAKPGTVYSFDYGNAHVVVLNTESGSKTRAKQTAWLRADLAKTQKLWKIVALHRGPYGATYDTTDIRKAWSPVFDEYHVDLVLQGHDHNYVRSYPMKGGKRVKAGEGTIYMVGNSGGVKFYPQKSRSWQEVNFQPKTQMYIAVCIDGRKMKLEAREGNNTLRDSLTLSK